jgi:hypothetical protein
MTTTTGNKHAARPADQGRTKHVLVRDDLDRLTLVRVRPWHRLTARCTAARLDGELAAGTSPETSITLAIRAMQLTSAKSRRALATSLQRILAAATGQQVPLSPANTVHPPRLPLCRTRIRQSAEPLAMLASYLTAPGPVPVQGVALVSQLLSNGIGPLYHQPCREDLAGIIDKATRALTQLNVPGLDQVTAAG